MTQRFRNAFDALTSAYVNGTLQHDNCTACAVGNIATYSGVDLNKAGPIWYNYILDRRESFVDRRDGFKSAMQVVKRTGYKIDEIDRIESTFEGTVKDYLLDSDDEDQAQYQGLIKVVELLAELDDLDMSEQVQNFKETCAG